MGLLISQVCTVPLLAELTLPAASGRSRSCAGGVWCVCVRVLHRGASACTQSVQGVWPDLRRACTRDASEVGLIADLQTRVHDEPRIPIVSAAQVGERVIDMASKSGRETVLSARNAAAADQGSQLFVPNLKPASSPAPPINGTGPA